jgi:hypothetical protein
MKNEPLGREAKSITDDTNTDLHVFTTTIRNNNQRNSVFLTVHAEMLQAGELVRANYLRSFIWIK